MQIELAPAPSPLDRSLDRALAALSGAPRAAHVRELIASLDRRRRASSPEAWRAFTERARAHPLAALLQRDPYTRRAFEKPRGYAGDAVMLDFVYGEHGLNLAALDPIGRAVWEATTGAPSAEAVRDRRRRLAAIVDEVAAGRDGAEVVSVAAGHARELDASLALRAGRVARWRCLDQDVESLAEVARRHRLDPRVSAERVAVRELLRDGLAGGADLVYSAGLFDYLRDDAARALLARLWTAVRPGGRLVVANFADDSAERGYMECFMDWWLLYRGEDELRALGGSLDGADLRVFRDPTGRTVWLDARRAGPRRRVRRG